MHGRIATKHTVIRAEQAGRGTKETQTKGDDKDDEEGQGWTLDDEQL